MSSKKEGPGFVYIIDCAKLNDPPKPDGYKIGETTNLPQRLRSLQIPTKGDVVHTFRFKNRLAAEKAAHQLFQSRRVPQSEWFKISPDQMEQVASFLRKKQKAETPRSISATKPNQTTTRTFAHQAYGQQVAAERLVNASVAYVAQKSLTDSINISRAFDTQKALNDSLNPKLGDWVFPACSAVIFGFLLMTGAPFISALFLGGLFGLMSTGFLSFVLNH